MSETRSIKAYTAHPWGEMSFGASLVSASIAIALICLAISFVLHQVEESAWKWVLLVTLGFMGLLIVIWFLFVVLRLLFRRRHAN